MEAPIFELQSRRDQIDLKIAELRAILDGDTSSQTAAPTCTPAKRAIYRIMIAPNIHTGKKVLLASIGSTALVGAVWSGMIAAAQTSQSAALHASFEVASIRANHSGDGIRNRFHLGHGGSFTATNCSLRLLIRYAFQIFPFQIAGAPGWVPADGYDIAAKAAGDPPIREFPPMLRSLLEDRFQLKAHWVTREAAVYDLIVSKAGKLRGAESGDCPSILDEPSSRPDGPPDDAPCGSLMNVPGHTKGHKLTSADLAVGLSFFLGRLVRDKTGLTGKYDIELEWTPDGALRQSPPPDAGPPSIVTALQQQLGLKLESAKGPVEILVIDHIERPSEN